MAEQIYYDSNYRFSDPVRFFKANDPYYFEVDNIPLKQLQENCLWLKDQIRQDSKTLLGVKRADLDELRPYATGDDRVLRVKPGRYTARVNDAATKTPLAYLYKVMGEVAGDVDAWATALPNPGGFPNQKNAILQAALDTFKQSISQDAMGMTGLVERAFTWPVINSDTPINGTGVNMVGQSVGGGSNIPTEMSYGGYDDNIPGGGAAYSPMVVTQALLWAKSVAAGSDSYVLPSFETTDQSNGWAKFPRTENYFIKRWRGVSRLAIVDVDDELAIEVPLFDPTDFSYINESGEETEVAGVQSRIDLVFIYSKPVDASGVNILTPNIPGKLGITKPTLGIVRGAGIKANFKESPKFSQDYKQNLNSDFGILAHPGDQKNTTMGFTATSSNDISQDIRGSFPAPDDILNIAPLISEKLEDQAYELIGQSILPVAYVWVQNGSHVVLDTDVIDIRPMFRTAELAYNERAGIGAAFPQLSLANPAVGKGQLDFEIKKSHDNLTSQIDVIALTSASTGILATGYVFGGWYFGPEGALFNYYQKKNGWNVPTSDSERTDIMDHVRSLYGFIDPSVVADNQGTGSAGQGVGYIPAYPDWDLASWCVHPNVSEVGVHVNDWINTFVSWRNWEDVDYSDPSIIAGSNDTLVYLGSPYPGVNGQTTETHPDNGGTSWADGARLDMFNNTEGGHGAILTGEPKSTVNFQYVSKKIHFDRPPGLLDYKIDIDLLNCLAESYRGSHGAHAGESASYFGTWVEKGWDHFTIYVSCVADGNANRQNTGINTFPEFPGPHSVNGVTLSERDGGRFSAFIVPVSDILHENLDPIVNGIHGTGYYGNPRVAKCTYPTIMWSFVGIPIDAGAFHYSNLNATNPSISLRS